MALPSVERCLADLGKCSPLQESPASGTPALGHGDFSRYLTRESYRGPVRPDEAQAPLPPRLFLRRSWSPALPGPSEPLGLPAAQRTLPPAAEEREAGLEVEPGVG